MSSSFKTLALLTSSSETSATFGPPSTGGSTSVSSSKNQEGVSPNTYLALLCAVCALGLLISVIFFIMEVRVSMRVRSSRVYLSL